MKGLSKWIAPFFICLQFFFVLVYKLRSSKKFIHNSYYYGKMVVKVEEICYNLIVKVEKLR